MTPRPGAVYMAHVRRGSRYDVMRARALAVFPSGSVIPGPIVGILRVYLGRTSCWARPDWRADLKRSADVVLTGLSRRSGDPEAQAFLHPAELVGEVDQAGAGRTYGTGECPQHGVWVGDRCYLCAADPAAQEDRAHKALRRWKEVLREL